MELDGGTLVAIVTAVAVAVGGFVGGRRTANREAISIATETVELLQAQIEALKSDKEDRDEEIRDLRTRVSVLENLVTQRAEVDRVHSEIMVVQDVVDRIASKVGA